MSAPSVGPVENLVPSGLSCGGQAIVSLNLNRTAAWIQDAATLLPSPVQVTLRPAMGPRGLLERHDVGDDLAGMRPIGQSVDDGHRGMVGVLGQRLVLVGADHDGIDVARDHLGRVRDGLAAADLQVGLVEGQRLPAELRMATSKDTRVRVEGFSKISISTASSMPSGRSSAGTRLPAFFMA